MEGTMDLEYIKSSKSVMKSEQKCSQKKVDCIAELRVTKKAHFVSCADLTMNKENQRSGKSERMGRRSRF